MASNDPKPIPQLSQKDIERFWSHVDIRGPDECWPWVGGLADRRYGKFTTKIDNHKYTLASHRVAYFLGHKDNPDNFLICHTCDNKPCANPEHLWKGTTQDNMRDCLEKGRRAKGDSHGSHTHPESRPRGDLHYHRLRPETIRRGAQHGRAILSDEKVLEIRRLYANGNCSYTFLAKAYKISKSSIAKIVKQKSWTHIT